MEIEEAAGQKPLCYYVMGRWGYVVDITLEVVDLA